MATVDVRPVGPEDCAGVAEFRLGMEGGGTLAAIRQEEFYQHKYLHWGRALVAEHQGRIAGTIAAIPKLVQVRGDVVPAADLGDLFVDPELRGQGVFRRLHDELLNGLAEDGVRMLTVRPSRVADPILRRAFGYQTLLPVKEWVAALDAGGVRELPLGRWPPARLLLPRVRGAPSEPPSGVVAGPELLRDLEPPQPFDGGWPAAGTVRDAAWLKERYADDPTPYEAVAIERGARVVGVLVQLVLADPWSGPTRSWIVDGWMGSADRDAATALAVAAITRLRHRGASVVHFWSARGAGRRADPVVRALRALGLRGISRGMEVLFLPVGGARLPPLPEPGSWMFRMGDTDGI